MKRKDEWAIPREQAIPELFKRHGNKLLGMSQRICGSRDEAEDLVQEVFMSAFREWDQFEGRSDPAVWLFTIARHSCQRRHRKRVGEPARIESLEELLPFGQPTVPILPESPSQELQLQLQESIGNQIASLPIDFRIALVLKEIVGFSVGEVAEILGISEGTVKSRVHRARLKLRKALDGRLPDEELPPTPYPKQLCLDLLTAKQEALDRGVEMPNADNIICDRCSAVFSTLDFVSESCRSLAPASPLTPQLEGRVLSKLGS